MDWMKKAVHHSKCNLLNIYDAKSNIQIDQMILQALMKANKTNVGLQITLAQAWNRIDIVKDEIFGALGETTDWERYHRDEKTISGNFHQALIKNQVGFVKLYLDNGVVSLEKFLKLTELKMLYIETKYKGETNVLEKLRSDIKDLTTLNFDGYLNSSKDSSIQTQHALELSALRLGSVCGGGWMLEQAPLEDPYRHLFIFAILNDFEEMAEYFWEEGQEHIASALVASKIYKSQIDKTRAINKEKQERFRKIEKNYDDLSCEVLDACESQSEKSDSTNILLRKLPHWGEKPV
ncbi:transient receptor potential cation channel subfamily M member 5-like [Amphiura filiformis]|uniref:transient receptor potential cation channel subfamily M member 5-like n=1 Tax=Amphiura filiformis TaxID=82378 RepID=UPI003B21B6AB